MAKSRLFRQVYRRSRLALACADQLGGVVQRAAVLPCQQKVTDGLVAVYLAQLAHGKEIVGAFAHLMVVDVQKTVVHPVPRKGAAVGTFALGDLVFVVREDQILAACVDIDGLAQMPARMALHSMCQPGRPLP